MKNNLLQDSQEWKSYQWQLKNSILSARELSHLFNCKSPYTTLSEVESFYPVRITPYYLSLIDPSDPHDPIAMQCLPDIKELNDATSIDSSPDPLAEHKYMVLPGLIHRYPDRVLLLAAHECAVRCRHCNRKRTWKNREAITTNAQLDDICCYLKKHPEVREVILSGGDPLMLSLEKLETILAKIKAISSVKVIRIGTRIPVTLPMKITPELVGVLKKYRPMWINTHFNHPKEITELSKKACEALICAGIPLSNQTVLLKNINDDFETLKELFTHLHAMMVRPYYLFQCDKVAGTDHFRTPISTGIKIMEQLWCSISGLCIPKFVVDLPKGGGKALTMPSYLLAIEEDKAIFRTYDGKIAYYMNP